LAVFDTKSTDITEVFIVLAYSFVLLDQCTKLEDILFSKKKLEDILFHILSVNDIKCTPMNTYKVWPINI
jgi:hypothetical protein